MHCEMIENRLHELLDSRRPLNADEALCEHLESCDECAELAAAYAAVARGEHVSRPTRPIAGLADRVLAEVNQARPLRRSAWRAGTAVALAASLLIAVGLALRNDTSIVEPPNAVELTVASDNTMMVGHAQQQVAHRLPARGVVGEDMWYQTGRGLATITLAGMRSTDSAAIEADGAVESEFIRRAYDALRQMWDPQRDAQPTNGETGWLDPAAPLAVV